MLDTLILSRIQFGANISFHILFPTISIALGWAHNIWADSLGQIEGSTGVKKEASASFLMSKKFFPPFFHDLDQKL